MLGAVWSLSVFSLLLPLQTLKSFSANQKLHKTSGLGVRGFYDAAICLPLEYVFCFLASGKLHNLHILGLYMQFHFLRNKPEYFTTIVIVIYIFIRFLGNTEISKIN